MTEFDVILSIFTAALVGVTVLVWRATVNVANATKQVAVVTKETSKITIRPRPTIIHHQKAGEDQEHHHYNFIIKNQGLGDAFDVRIETIDKKGSQLQVPIPRLRREQSIGFKATNIERSKNPVKMKITYKDVMNNPYSDEFDYDIGNDIFFLQELSDDSREVKFD
jgi:hypothetical protein